MFLTFPLSLALTGRLKCIYCNIRLDMYQLLFSIMFRAEKRSRNKRAIFISDCDNTKPSSLTALCYLYILPSLVPSGPISHGSNYKNRMLSESLSFWKVADKRRIRGRIMDRINLSLNLAFPKSTAVDRNVKQSVTKICQCGLH